MLLHLCTGPNAFQTNSLALWPTPELHSSLNPSQHHGSPQRQKPILPIFKTQVPGTVLTDMKYLLNACRFEIVLNGERFLDWICFVKL